MATVTRVEAQLAGKDMAIELTPAAKSLLARRGFDPVLGARPLRRTIQREIEDQMSEKILFGAVEGGQIVIVDVEGVNPMFPRARTPPMTRPGYTFRGEPEPVLSVPNTPPIRPGWWDERSELPTAASGSRPGAAEPPGHALACASPAGRSDGTKTGRMEGHPVVPEAVGA